MSRGKNDSALSLLAISLVTCGALASSSAAFADDDTDKHDEQDRPYKRGTDPDRPDKPYRRGRHEKKVEIERPEGYEKLDKAELRLEELRNIEVPEPIIAPLTPEEAAEAEAADRLTIERIRFIEHRLQKARRPMATWYGIWTGGYAAGTVVQAVRAGFEHRPAQRGELAISTAKAGVGSISRGLRMPKAMRADEEIARMPVATPADRRLKLMAAERILARNAKESDQRYSHVGHTVNLLVNVGAGIVVGAVWKDWAVAGQSMATGVAVGEASMWTMPWWTAKRDFKEYRARYGETLSEPRISAENFSGPRYKPPVVPLVPEPPPSPAPSPAPAPTP